MAQRCHVFDNTLFEVDFFGYARVTVYTLFLATEELARGCPANFVHYLLFDGLDRLNGWKVRLLAHVLRHLDVDHVGIRQRLWGFEIVLGYINVDEELIDLHLVTALRAGLAHHALSLFFDQGDGHVTRGVAVSLLVQHFEAVDVLLYLPTLSHLLVQLPFLTHREVFQVLRNWYL